MGISEGDRPDSAAQDPSATDEYAHHVHGEAGPLSFGAVSTGDVRRPWDFRRRLSDVHARATEFLGEDGRGRDILRHAREKGLDVIAQAGREPRVIVGSGLAKAREAVDSEKLKKGATTAAEIAAFTAAAVIVYKFVQSRRNPDK